MAVGLSGGELGFELVAQGHQCVDPGDDAVLLGERGEGKGSGALLEVPSVVGQDPLPMKQRLRY